MKKKVSFTFFIPLLILLWGFSSYALTAGGGLVTGVLDGDTIQMADGQRIRYLGIDCPERGGGDRPSEFLAEEAYSYNRSLVYKKEVRLEEGVEARDQYGRVLAYVFLVDGLFVNEELIKQGLAHVLYFGPRMDRFEELLRGQREAIQNSRGLWTRALLETDDGYRGQKETRRFHHLSCPFGKKISLRNLMIFSSKKEAYWQGYSPCRHCQP